MVEGAAVVQAGAVNLTEAASSLVAGLPFAHIVEPLPPNLRELGGDGRAGEGITRPPGDAPLPARPAAPLDVAPPPEPPPARSPPPPDG